MKLLPTTAWWLCEQERQVLRHRVRLVRGGEESVRLQAPVLVVLLHGEHLVVALCHTGCVGVAFARQRILESSDLMIVLEFSSV